MLCLQPTDILNLFSLFGSLRGFNNCPNIVSIMVESYYIRLHNDLRQQQKITSEQKD